MAGKNTSAFDFEFPREIQVALSIAPKKLGSGGDGGGGSVYSSSVNRLRTSQSKIQSSAKSTHPHLRDFVGGGDDVSLTFSTSLTSNMAGNNNGTWNESIDSIHAQ